MIRQAFSCILRAVIPAGVFYVAAIIILNLSGFAVVEVLRDPAQMTEQSSWLGFMSNAGNALWVAAAAILLFTATTRDALTKQHRELLLFLAILSMMLSFDDFFLIHDRYVDQRICYGVYVLLGATLALRHWRLILAIDAISFVLAGSLLALSILSDLTQYLIPIPYEYVQVFEEGFKFTGIASWLYFCCRVALYRPETGDE